MLSTASRWAALSPAERGLLIHTFPLRCVPTALRWRTFGRQFGFAGRRLLSAEGDRLAFARYLRASGRLTDD